MRISDWSSDVCSSDLPGAPARPALDLVLQAKEAAAVVGRQDQVVGLRLAAAVGGKNADVADAGLRHAAQGFDEAAGLDAGGHHGAAPVSRAAGQIGRAHV